MSLLLACEEWVVELVLPLDLILEDFLELGQEVVVKVLKIDERGRVNLSIKAVTQEDLERVGN